MSKHLLSFFADFFAKGNFARNLQRGNNNWVEGEGGVSAIACY
jgi:hypothetical protein